SPCPEMLRCEIGPHGHPQIVIYILGGNGAAISLLINILKQLLSRQFLYGAHDTGNSFIGKLKFPHFTRFASKNEPHSPTIIPQMSISKGGNAKALIVACVIGISDPQQ